MGVGGKFVFGGVTSDSIGLTVSGPAYPIPERDEEQIEVPGRNGALLFDNGRYKNTTITYSCVVGNYERNGETVRYALASLSGYRRLEDSYRPDIFRIARLSGEIQPEMGLSRKYAKLSVSFDCKPQCYLKEGEKAIEADSGDMIYNRYPFASKPLIRVYGHGSIYIGSQLITIAEHNESYMDIDSETMDAFCGADNLNAALTMANDGFPELIPGENKIKSDSTITKILITPRWWVL